MASAGSGSGGAGGGSSTRQANGAAAISAAATAVGSADTRFHSHHHQPQQDWVYTLDDFLFHGACNRPCFSCSFCHACFRCVDEYQQFPVGLDDLDCHKFCVLSTNCTAQWLFQLATGAGHLYHQ
jgi:hypothetical protein